MSLHFIEPLDVLFLRGNKVFGDPGSFGESVMPPPPSVVAGALRSALLVSKGIDPLLFARGDARDVELGTPDDPGPFAVAAFGIARQNPKERESFESLLSPPADLYIAEREGHPSVNALAPVEPPDGIRSSSPTGRMAVLPVGERSKPATGYYLTAAGWRDYLAGRPIDPISGLVRMADLWAVETRVGIGLDPLLRRAADGQLFSTQAIAFSKVGCESRAEKGEQTCGVGMNAGFFVDVDGADVPPCVMLRLGGDGRAAVCRLARHAETPVADYGALAAAGRCRMILATPGIFAKGWLPTGTTGDFRFDLHGVRGRVVCAAVPQAEVVSGFDLAKAMPKTAHRAAQAGSVYWLDELEATPDGLRNLVARGLWSEPAENEGRRAEGFNRLMLAA